MDFYQVLYFLILRDVEPATGFTAKEGRCVSKVACSIPEVEGDQDNQEVQEDKDDQEDEDDEDDEENDVTTEKAATATAKAKDDEGVQENQDDQENKVDPEVTTEKAAATTAKPSVN